jgi:electron transfer flavoprotein beta subunit
MRIAICCKGVPIDMAVDVVNNADGDINYTGTNFYINEFDSYALETALNLKQKYNTETIAISLGPLRSQEVLYFALAKGIDKAIRIDGQTGRPEMIASGLLPVLKEVDPQLVLVGVQSEDWMGAEVGIYLAQALNMSRAYAVTEIKEINESEVRVKKELGAGKTAEVVLKLPAVLCIQSGIHPLQYISKGRLKRARSLPINMGGSVDPKDVKEKIPGMTSYEVVGVEEPSREGRAEMITGERSEKVKKLIEIISKIA